MHNLDYGDQDSVGVFQQRPSEGWGTASELEDPVYATSKFFGALIRVPGWLDLPVDQAAQAVQHSADGSAYSQYDLMAATLTSAYTGQRRARRVVLARSRTAAAAEHLRGRSRTGRRVRRRRRRQAGDQFHRVPFG